MKSTLGIEDMKSTFGIVFTVCSLSLRNNRIAGKQKIDRGHLGLFFYCVSPLDSK
jgi:hypothetical protein